jgi:hypothetical protein
MYYIESSKGEKEFETLDEVYKYCDELDEQDIDFESYEDCKECEGEIVYHVLTSWCNRPVSDCCGGCTEEIHCEECNDGRQTLLL